MPWILGTIGVAASALMVLAWWVGGSERALFAHAVSLAIAVGLVTLAADIFDREDVRRRPIHRAHPKGQHPLGYAWPGSLLLSLCSQRSFSWG